MLTFGPLAPALAAGNTAVIKPSELAVATSALIAELVPRYLDHEAVAVVEGAVPETTALLEQQWDFIFFTGGRHGQIPRPLGLRGVHKHPRRPLPQPASGS
ncbi:MAG: aldehyde dehydrogenase family protein [Streptosporangiaceae bacterium]|jgi:aldehyde dehydrogenase (NAD+)